MVIITTNNIDGYKFDHLPTKGEQIDGVSALLSEFDEHPITKVTKTKTNLVGETDPEGVPIVNHVNFIIDDIRYLIRPGHPWMGKCSNCHIITTAYLLRLIADSNKELDQWNKNNPKGFQYELL